MQELLIIGGGLAGCEAAWQSAKQGIQVALCEMRPDKLTEAHKTGLLGELVCSNSFRSADPLSASGLLKEELRLADSLIMLAAEASKIPAGSALAVDRNMFSEYITNIISNNPYIRIIREEVAAIPDTISIIATGPLTSVKMTEALNKIIGNEYLYFYDAIAPIIDTDSIDFKKVYLASRYGKGSDDYINCPMTREEYTVFYRALIEADKVNLREFEQAKVFEGCMPVEVMALRGEDTLRFGPMKPVGLANPGTGKEAYAVVQLRQENNEKTAYNMVGFQTRLKWPEQKRVFRLIPGLERAEFLRFGSQHRNTFIDSPALLNMDLSLKVRHNIFISGQITGVEGYIESTAMGLIAGINAARTIKGQKNIEVPATTAHGSLIRHITRPQKNFQPSNINFGLLPDLDFRIKDKKIKKEALAERAINNWEGYLREIKS